MNERIRTSSVDILLVEDNPGDIRLVKENLKEFKVCNNLHVVNDGEEAMAFLRKKGKYRDVPSPDLVLLDLNLPKKDGREVLAEIRADKDLTAMPVVILTGSKAEEDIIKAYKLHANCYISKPLNLEQFARIVKTIEEFWFSIVKLPSRD